MCPVCHQDGAGFRDVVRNVGRKVGKAAVKTNAFLREHKIISRLAKAAELAGVPNASTVGAIAEQLGYGHRRGARMRGGARMSGGRRSRTTAPKKKMTKKRGRPIARYM